MVLHPIELFKRRHGSIMRSAVLLVLLLAASVAGSARAQGEKYTGIGVTFTYIGGSSDEDERLRSLGLQIRVFLVLRDGPAAQAGVREGDPVIRVEDGRKKIWVTVSTLDEAAALIKGGLPGTKVRLVVGRRDRNSFLFLREKPIDIERAELSRKWAPFFDVASTQSR